MEHFPKNLLHFLRHVLQSTTYFLIGLLVVFPGFLCFILITIPAYIYRIFVSKVLAKTFFAPVGLAHIVSPGYGTGYAAEFYKCSRANPARPSRNAIVSSTLVSGRISETYIKNLIQSRWLYAKSLSGKLKYPEFRQYIISWMGYMFWKEDTQFQLENHFKSHYMNGHADLEAFSASMEETLLNKPFSRHTSPWECHVVYSCDCEFNDDFKTIRNCKTCGKKEDTVILIRIHHCLADGLSIIYAVFEALYGCRLQKLSDENQVYQKVVPSKQKHWSLFAKSKVIIFKLLEFFRGLGFILVFFLFRINRQSSLHISDDKKSWNQISVKSDRLSVQKLKQIKNHFKVSFSSLLLSCISSALSKQTNSRSQPGNKNMLIAFPSPLPGHPMDRLINHL